MKKFIKTTILSVFISIQLISQSKGVVAVRFIPTAQKDSLPEQLKRLYVNKPNEDAMRTFTKFITCFRLPDILHSAAPIQFTAMDFKGIKSVRVFDDGFSIPTYYAVFDKAGNYTKLNYYEVYAVNPYVTLTFDYDKKESFAEVVNTYNEKKETLFSAYATEDTIILKGETPVVIYQDAFDIYKKTGFDFTANRFNKAAAVCLDEKAQYCIQSNTVCTYSTIAKNVFRYDYNFGADRKNGYEMIYYNSRNLLTKIEIFEKGRSRNTITLVYKYYEPGK